jgi:hypothetical protein
MRRIRRTTEDGVREEQHVLVPWSRSGLVTQPTSDLFAVLAKVLSQCVMVTSDVPPPWFVL